MKELIKRLGLEKNTYELLAIEKNIIQTIRECSENFNTNSVTYRTNLEYLELINETLIKIHED